MRSRLAAFVSLAALATGLADPVVVSAQAASSQAASPSIDRSVLPIPLPGFQGSIGATYRDSRAETPPPSAPAAPAGAPNILLVLLDDAGYAQTSAFGAAITTPTLDALAANGLRYTRFHVTPMCSPTRASLLTGRNHHAIGMGTITNWASSYPGYTGVLPKSSAFVSEILRANGYATAAIGKWHLTPVSEMTPSGPYDRWPSGQGFDYFYGFIQAETDQWAPQINEGVKPGRLDPPKDRAGDYTLNEAMADHTIAWLRSQKSVNPDKPFFIYYAPGGTHAPLQAPKAWIDKFKGRFDMGWDKYREQVFARQKALGVVPADATLTPRPPELPAWDSLSPDERKVQARMMEVYAGFMAQTDHEIGRVIDAIRQTGQLDNTLIVFIAGDNGASQEGGPEGAINSMAQINGVTDTTAERLRALPTLGGASTTPMYGAGWAWAGNTPFQWSKRIGSHLGATRDPLVISWPSRVKDPGATRWQYEHVIDIAPTLLEAAGVPQPRRVNGVDQAPFDGASLLATIDSGAASSRRTTQYYEMLGNRAIYHDGWLAAQRTGLAPWVYSSVDTLKPQAWELYDLDHDYSQAHDVAAANPARLKALQDLFDAEAKRNQVLPIDPRVLGRGQPDTREAVHRTYYGQTRLYSGMWPPVENRSFSITARIVAPARDGDGPVVSMGGESGGFSLYVKDGKPAFTYNFFQKQITTVQSPTRLGAGPAKIAVRLVYDGGGPGQGATAILSVDDKVVGQARVPRTSRGKVSFEDTFDIGEDSGSPVVDYGVAPTYPGVLDKVEVDLDPVS